jgi:hypothetical protein
MIFIEASSTDMWSRFVDDPRHQRMDESAYSASRRVAYRKAAATKGAKLRVEVLRVPEDPLSLEFG